MFKSSILFKIGLILVLISMLGGAPMSAAAAAVMLVWSPTTSPGSFDYGTLNSGDTSSQQFTLTNGRNSGALTASLSGSPAFSITSDGCTGVRLGKNPSCAVTVQYAPTGSGQSDTATLSASNKKGDSASITLTGASAAPCVINADLLPPGGIRLTGTIFLDASGTTSSGCSVPLRYLWDCSTTSGVCPAFLASANNAPYYDQTMPTIELLEASSIDILLTVCDANWSNCAPLIVRTYSADLN